MTHELSIVVPCLNECDNVRLVVDRLVEVAPGNSITFEVIFVDGGSSDGTVTTLEDIISSNDLDYIRVLRADPGQGYGRDILTGLAVADGKILAWTHADLQTDILDVFKAHEAYHRSGGNVFVKGNRKNRAFVESFFSFGMELVAFAATRVRLKDINAQPKLFDRRFYEDHLREDAPDDFSLDLYACYKARTSGMEIVTIPVIFASRRFGEAKGGGGSWKNRIRLIRRTNRYIWTLASSIKRKEQ